MEPSDRDELTDPELDSLLQQWQAPPAPARLKTALFPNSSPWWRRMWSARVPLPAALALAAALVLSVWRSSVATPAVIVRTERLEVPVAQSAPLPAAESPKPDPHGRQLRPVLELKPIILRSAE